MGRPCSRARRVAARPRPRRPPRYPAALRQLFKAQRPGQTGAAAPRHQGTAARRPGTAARRSGTAARRSGTAARRPEARRPAPRPVGPGRSRLVRQRVQIVLDRRRQRLSLSVPEQWKLDESDARLYPTLGAALRLKMIQRVNMVPAAMLLAKSKQFDDGLLAAVERAMSNGLGRLPSRNAFVEKLARLLQKLQKRGQIEAAVLLAAASKLAGRPVATKPAVERGVESLLSRFLRSQKAKPLSFYTWRPGLERAFRRDRLLQRKLERGPGLALARLLARRKALNRSYRRFLELEAKLTNPPRHRSLTRFVRAVRRGRTPRWPRRRPVALFPAAQSPEDALIQRLYGNRPIPKGFNLMDEVVRRVRKGRLRLEPRKNAGWYGHKLYALEPLIRPEKTPEARHLAFSKEYKEVLEQLFKASQALARETHSKSLGWGAAGAGMAGNTIRIKLYPTLSVEPLATHYLRQARAYRFIRDVLHKALGKGALSRLRRLTRRGPVSLPLDQEIDLMAGLYHGAYLRACDQIGLAPKALRGLGSGNGRAADRALFAKWREHAAQDPDVGADQRMMVPVFYDLQRRKLKVWVVLGVVKRTLTVKFKRRPRIVAVIGPEGKTLRLRNGFWESKHSSATVSIRFNDTLRRTLWVPVFAEVYVKKLLNRTEFRKLCDQHRTKRQILAHLK